MRSTSKMTKRIFTMLLGLTTAALTGQALAQGGTWETKAPMPTARSGVATGVINGHLYVVVGTLSTANEVYDPVANTWATKASAPTSRAYAGAAAIAGKLYVVGGCINSDCIPGITNILEVFDPATNTWATKTPMPTARSGIVAGAIDGKLYVVGGSQQCGPCVSLNTLEVYDSATDTWTTKASMPTARSGMGGAVIDGKLHVVGGWQITFPGGPQAALATLEVYDPSADAWTTKAPMPTGRRFLGAGEVNSTLYAVSGNLAGDISVNTVEAYDPATDIWTTVAPIPTARFLPQPQGIGGVLYVAGAGAGNTDISTLEAFTPEAPNQPPIANAGADQTVDATSPAGALVTLDGTGSSDPDGDPLTFSWIVLFGTAGGATPTVLLPVGMHIISLTVTDPSGATGTDIVTVTVRSPAEMTSNLTTAVTVLEFQQAVKLLGNIVSQINAGNLEAGCNQLNAFINQAQAQSGKQLTVNEANQLIASANQIRAALGCP